MLMFSRRVSPKPTTGPKQPHARGSTFTITVPPSDKPQKIEVTLCEILGEHNARIGVHADRSIQIERDDCGSRPNGCSTGQPATS